MLAIPFEQKRHRAAQANQYVPLVLRQSARLTINDAQRSDFTAFARDKRRTSIKTDARIVCHERIVCKTHVLGRIGDFKYFAVVDRVRTERDIARRLFRIKSDDRFEPLAMFIHQADHGDRRTKDERRCLHQLVQDRMVKSRYRMVKS